MRKYLKIILPLTLTFVMSLVLVSCKKYLDKAPLSDIKETEAFKNFKNFQGFTEEMYNSLPLFTAVGSHNNWNFGDDEMWEPTETRMFAYNVDQGDYRAWNSAIFGSEFKNSTNSAQFTSQGNGDKGNLWSQSWGCIRKANIGLANLDKLTEATDEERNLIAGQLYFFRGFYHFMLMTYWGGLPYIDKVLPTDETPKLPRLNYQATADKVAADLKKASELLPVNWDETTVGLQTKGNNNWRINKIMALAFLGKNLLYAGSPLMNRESTGNPSYNADYCKKAADAFAQALQIIESTGRYKMADFSQYRQVFYTWNQNSKIPGLEEAIFMENLAGAGGRFRWNQVNDYRPYTINGSGLKCYPTANYVDNYGMANGLPITDPEKADPESGYDPRFPFRNRDPRFYNDIMIDGEKAVNNAGNVGNDEYRQYASLFTGGKYRTLDPVHAMLTGYMEAKWASKLMNDWDGYKDNNTVVLSLLRLPDVYLMYAEAVSEGYNSPTAKVSSYSKTAVDAVNFVRDRPGLGVGHVADKFLTSQDAFRSEYRRERAVELSFEGHRFNDLRRWLLLTERPYTLRKAVQFDRVVTKYKTVNGVQVPDYSDLYADPKNGQVLNFRETVLFERQLGQRHYWFPFINSDVNLYPEFTQNPGW